MTSLPNPQATFLLDVADKAIKAAAVAVGGLWAYWNYRKSRIYEKKLELQLTANTFTRGDLYLDIDVSMRNVGASRHTIPPDSTFCTVSAVLGDLSELPLHIFSVFESENQLEPGESTNDALFWRVQTYPADVVWLKIEVQTFSGELQWGVVSSVRAE